MTIGLGDLTAEATFPLYGVHPSRWGGASFVGDTEHRNGRLTSVTLVYEQPGRAFAIDNVEAGAGDVDDDFVRFVARFEPRFVTRKLKRRRRAFPESSFATHRIETVLRGARAALDVLEHKDLPLVLAPLRLEETTGATDVWVCGWALDVREVIPLVESIGPAMVAAFDAPGEPYPPPEWDEGPAG